MVYNNLYVVILVLPLYTVPNQGLYNIVAAGVVAALLMLVLLIVCVGVPVCYCAWRKKKASKLELSPPSSVYACCVPGNKENN